MGSVSDSEGSKIKKILLWVFIIYVVSNHTVALFAGSTSFAPERSLSTFTSSLGSSVVNSLNSFRLRTGTLISDAGAVCPSEGKPTCDKILYGVRFALGLY